MFSYSGTSLQISQVADPLGRTVRYTYDGAGRLATVTDPAGGVTSYTNDSANRLTTITDPRGILFLRNGYDGAGRVSRQTQADGGVFTFAYTVTSGVVTQTAVTDADSVDDPRAEGRRDVRRAIAASVVGQHDLHPQVVLVNDLLRLLDAGRERFGLIQAWHHDRDLERSFLPGLPVRPVSLTSKRSI